MVIKEVQEDIDRMMTEGKVHLLLPKFMPQLRNAPGPCTFKTTHVNDFFESRNAGLWKDHDWPEWTLTAGATQVTLACFMLERDMNPSFDDDQYLVLTQDGEEEENDGVIACWSEDDDNWFFDEA